ncbi:MAG: VCBS repeat-containing protein [Planctomycetes bacterium]|nr:VCBS repeat-containing protein [Planctomycetota bacterium]
MRFVDRVLPPSMVLCLGALTFAQPTPQLNGPPILKLPRLRVVRVNPPPETVGFDRAAHVSITFNRAVDPATLSPSSLHVLGRWSGPVAGQFVLSNGGRTVTFVRSRGFSAGEAVFVNVARQVRAIEGDALGTPYAFTFWARSDAAPMTFTHTQTLLPGRIPYGAHGGDLDDDGDLDLAVPNEDSSNVSVFLNVGGDTFVGPTNYGVGFHCSPSEGLDLNGDGIVDLVVANILDHNVSVLIGRGDGTFLPQRQYPVGNQPRGLTVFDVDGDGDADVITANRQSSNLSLLINRGDGTFEKQIPFEAGVGGETGVAAADMNGDGLFDLVVVGYSSSEIATLLGDGNGGFSFHTKRASLSRPWMVVCGDVNGDSIPDAAAAISGAGRGEIFLGDGVGGLDSSGSYPAGSFPIAIDLGDLDGDGDLDMTVSSYSSRRFTVFRNLGGGVFSEAARLSTPGAGSCTVLHDRDGDGIVDLTGIDEVADLVRLYRQP